MASQEHILLSTEQYKRLIDRIPKSEDLVTDSDKKANFDPVKQSNLVKKFEDKTHSDHSDHSDHSEKDTEKIAGVKNPDRIRSSSSSTSINTDSSSNSSHSPRVKKRGVTDARKPRKRLTKEEIKKKFLLPGTRHPGNFENTPEALRLVKKKWVKL